MNIGIFGEPIVSYNDSDDEALWLFDAEGVCHVSVEDMANHMIGVCGCAGDDVLRSMVLLLRVFSDGEGIKGWVKEGESEALFYAVATLADRQGLIEHGVSIRFSWLTEKGQTLLALADCIFAGDE